MKKTSILILIAAFLMAAVLLCNEVGLFAVHLPEPENPGSSASCADTAVPGTTDGPDSTGVPISTRSPESTKVPETTDEPETTQAPETTDEPETTNAPETTDAPETTNAPETTDAPETTQAPPVTTAPVTEPPAPKPVVGISSTNGYSVGASYITAAQNAGFEVRVLPFVTTKAAATAQLAKVDALIMTGGQDIDPAYYGEEVRSGANVEIYPARDTSDFLYIQTALEADMPMLCICRGMQILNVACGGTLVQDIALQTSSSITHRDPNRMRFLTHSITTVSGSIVQSFLGETVLVNSWHHQAVGSAGIHVNITAYAPDGVIEAIEITDKTFAVGVQFHPEEYAKSGNPKFLQFFTALRDVIPTKQTGV